MSRRSDSPRSRAHDGRTATQFRFPPELHRRLVGAADERGVNLNWLVVKLLEDAVEHLIPAAEIRLTRSPAERLAAGCQENTSGRPAPHHDDCGCPDSDFEASGCPEDPGGQHHIGCGCPDSDFIE